MTDDKAAAKREANRRYRERNRERLNEYYKQWRERNREHAREYDRHRTANDPDRRRRGLESLQRWAEENPERAREAAAEYREANRERINAGIRQWKRDNAEHRKAVDAAWRAANRDRVNATSRQAQRARRARGYVVPSRARRRELTERLWREQDGQCYLCERPVELADAVLDHDHRCCPLDAYCSYCVRGVACNGCNQAIGILKDDPGLLELVAHNLRTKLTEVSERLASKPEQLTLSDAEERHG